MRILHVVPTYFPAVRYGGPIHSVHGLCNSLALAGHDVHVFTTSVDGPGDLDVPVGQPVMVDSVKVTYFPSRQLRRLYWSPSMGRALKEWVPGFDIVHLHSIFLWPTSAAARVAERQGIPYVVAPRGMLVKDLVRMKGRLRKLAWLGLVERRTLERASVLHVTSEQERRDAMEFGWHFSGIEVVPNGVEVGPAIPVPQIDNRTLLFLGRISWKKGLDRLIPALHYLPGVQLLVAGNDEEGLRPSLEQLARDHGVASQIRFLGAVGGQQKDQVLREATILVLPSYNENFGNVILESLTRGRPVAVTREVGLAGAVEAAGVGRILPPDPVGMAGVLADMLADAATLDAMGALGRGWVEQNFSWPVIAQQMETIYRRMRDGVAA